MNKVYYESTVSIEPSVVGLKDGMGQIAMDRVSNKEALNFFNSYLSRTNHEPPAHIEFTNMNLKKRGKLTDFIKIPGFLFGCPFIMSKSAIGVFSQFKIQKHYYLNTDIHLGSEIYTTDYKIFYCPYLEYEVIDFNKTIFYYQSGEEFSDIKFKDSNAFTNFQKTLGARQLEALQLVLKKNLIKDLDLFSIKAWGRVYISEQLKQSIIENKLIGLEYRIAREPSIVLD